MNPLALATSALALQCASAAAGPGTPEWTCPGPGGAQNGQVVAFTVFDRDGAGPGAPALIAGGTFFSAGQAAANGVASWDGTSWTPLGIGVSNGIDVRAIVEFDEDGPGPLAPCLFAGGNFIFAGGQSVNGIARWDGQAWSPLPIEGGPGTCFALRVFDEDGPGPGLPALFAAGDGLKRWDGVEWSSVTIPPGGEIRSMLVFDDGVGGESLYISNPLRRWDGAVWTSIGGAEVNVECMASYDPDGPGPARERLIVGGAFLSIGGVAADYIAQWNGQQWSSLGNGLTNSAYSMAVLDEDGAGPGLPALFVTGNFSHAGGLPVNGIAKWDGTNWTPVGAGAGLDGTGFALAVFNDTISGGWAPALYVGGNFDFAGGVACPNLARWGGVAPPPGPCVGDASGDGIVDFIDIVAVLSHWGEGCP